MFITTQLILASFISSSVPDLDSGKKLRQEGKLEEAIVAFQEILASQPDLPEAQLELGHSLALAGQYREAIEAYERLAASKDLRWQMESAKWGGWAHIYQGDIASYYQKFLALWGDAEGSLPGVTDAKKRLRELQAAS